MQATNAKLTYYLWFVSL